MNKRRQLIQYLILSIVKSTPLDVSMRPQWHLNFTILHLGREPPPLPSNCYPRTINMLVTWLDRTWQIMKKCIISTMKNNFIHSYSNVSIVK